MFRLVLTMLTLSFVDLRKSDVGLTPLEMIENHGYASETHDIQTEDGYIITYYRIPSKLNEPKKRKPPVMIVHGLISSAAEFVNMAERSLGFVLSDNGYDVWLANCRGTTFSRKHVNLDPINNSKEFFAFSWHEIGYYDLPSAIDYILNITNYDSLYYIGHSQGTTSLLVMGSTRPEYNKKIRLANLLAPSARMNHNDNPIFLLLSANIFELEQLAYDINLFEVPFLGFVRNATRSACERNQYLPICRIGLALIQIYLDPELIPVVLTNAPSSFSIRQPLHYGQCIKNGKFAPYDFGGTKNMKIYGARKPPSYPVKKITAPIALYYAVRDGLVSPQDARDLRDQLPNVVEDYVVPERNFNHFDFIFGKNVYNVVFKELLKVMKRF